MNGFLSRDQAPLSPDHWEALDRVVVEVARRTLVGRRLLHLHGPLGPGYQVIAGDVYADRPSGAIDMIGEADCGEVRAESRRYLPLPILHKDFMIHWRDLEEARQAGAVLDTAGAAAAAAHCARLEDDVIFNGYPELGYHGLVNVPGRLTLPQSDWAVMGAALQDVTAAVERLWSRGFAGPFAVAVSPRLLVAMNRMFENSGVLEIDQVRKIATAGVFVVPGLPEPSAAVIATGPENFDIVVGLDMTTAYLQADKMNHHFRVFETLALRIRRPDAVCAIEWAGPRPAPQGDAG